MGETLPMSMSSSQGAAKPNKAVASSHEEIKARSCPMRMPPKLVRWAVLNNE
ncbi:hypothetical protein M6B38_238490 [Iris pallida]|uniref:Uncharacterized protein n=1 Tax=Iris pallida TaxID=29817 RepID=A0AAX6DLG3_IRIPA|nr:hypothetical protein M6B38_238490 [Iris pallida]